MDRAPGRGYGPATRAFWDGKVHWKDSAQRARPLHLTSVNLQLEDGRRAQLAPLCCTPRGPEHYVRSSRSCCQQPEGPASMTALACGRRCGNRGQSSMRIVAFLKLHVEWGAQYPPVTVTVRHSMCTTPKYGPDALEWGY
jgi:hypothetical protein